MRNVMKYSYCVHCLIWFSFLFHNNIYLKISNSNTIRIYKFVWEELCVYRALQDSHLSLFVKLICCYLKLENSEMLQIQTKTNLSPDLDKIQYTCSMYHDDDEVYWWIWSVLLFQATINIIFMNQLRWNPICK